MAFRKRNPFGGLPPPVGSVLDGADPINQGLVGFWPLTESAGDVASNIANASRAGLRSGNATWEAKFAGRQFGAVTKFGTADDYLSVGSYDFSASKEFSIVVWALMTASDQTDGAGLFCCGNGGGGEQYNIDLRSSPNGGWVRFYTRDSGGGVNGNISAAANSAISQTQWRLIVGTFSGRNTRQRLYYDGALAASATVTSSLNAVSGHTTSIGARQSGSGSYDMAANCHIAAPRIYARELTQGEVLRILRDPYAGVLEPRRRMMSSPAVGGAVPTITAVSAENITATSADYRVTLDFA